MTVTKEWTLMFYFASDNPLAPGVVSQLKSIKNAGFHPDANVIAQFDPRTEGTPTHIFDVNLVKKLKNHGAPNVGFAGNDPFVRSLLEDKLWGEQRDRTDRFTIKELIRKSLKKDNIIYDPPTPPDGKAGNAFKGHGNKESDPRRSLEDFLEFCADKYPARHYMLFILGHGIIVGNDVFLFDEHADTQSLSLKGLGEVLACFRREVDRQKAQFELVSFHSCSVSSAEVAYELQGTANYMLASQGTSFVGSWPYRNILIRVFNDLIKDGSHINVKKLIIKIFQYCFHNSTDFLMAGYSFDLALCNLKRVRDIKAPLRELSNALLDGLNDPSDGALVRDLILLAHWKAQSFWQETYTDLYDFCICLSRSISNTNWVDSATGPHGECKKIELPEWQMTEKLRAINRACGSVMHALMKEKMVTKENGNNHEDKRENKCEKLIVRTEYAGPSTQYSHGLSVFFPWSRPSADNPISEEYRSYRFEETLWRTFLEGDGVRKGYYDATLRATRKDEDECDIRTHPQEMQSNETDEVSDAELLEDITSLVYNEEGQLSSDSALYAPSPDYVKTNPKDPLGDSDFCPSIKNYPHDTRARNRKRKVAARSQLSTPLSDTNFSLFE